MGAKKIVGYVSLTDDGTLTVDNVKKLDIINLAFGIIDQGSISFDQQGVYARLPELRAANPQLKVVLSLVGKSGADFPAGSATAAGREQIARSCCEMVTQYDLDGIDLDWEFPCCPANRLDATPADRENFTALVQAIRTAFDALDGPKKLLTIAAGGDAYFTKHTEMHLVAPLLDYVYVMTYDLRCGFHALTGHHTNLFDVTGDIFHTSCCHAVSVFQQAGVLKEKLLIGAAFYSRQWTEVPDRRNGFLQYTKNACTYGPDYHTLLAEYIDQNGYVRYWDDEAKAPYLFNGSTFITYDDSESLTHKAHYVKEADLAGIFYWEHKTDRTHTLLEALYQGIQS